MGQLVVQEFVTADGFAADTNNAFEFHDRVDGSWDEADARTLPWVEAASAVVLGARTYAEFVEFWPTPASESEILAPIINVIPKYVFSASLEAAEWGDFAPATLESGDAIEAIRRIKRDSPGDVIGQPVTRAELFHGGRGGCAAPGGHSRAARRRPWHLSSRRAPSHAARPGNNRL
jgi:hypothetical protein